MSASRGVKQTSQFDRFTPDHRQIIATLCGSSQQAVTEPKIEA